MTVLIGFKNRQFNPHYAYTGYKTLEKLPQPRERFYLLYGEKGRRAIWIECSEKEYQAYTEVKKRK